MPGALLSGLKNRGSPSYRGRSAAREPGIHEHQLEKQGFGLCSWVPGFGPKGRPGTTTEFFRSCWRNVVRALRGAKYFATSRAGRSAVSHSYGECRTREGEFYTLRRAGMTAIAAGMPVALLL